MRFHLQICIIKPQRRIDAYLSKLYPERSRSFFQHIIESSSLLINNIVIKKVSTELRKGDEISISHNIEDTPWHIEGRTDIALDILYQDKDTLVINKPLGLTVHPGDDMHSRTLSVAHALLGLPDTEFSIKDTARPGIVHRLDKWTSGVLLTAKNDQAVNYYSAQFKERTVQKEYIALVYGAMTQSHGFIDAPIGRSPRDRKKMAVVANGKPASTEFHVLASTKDFTLLRIILHTGRTHQIRVHFANIGFPLVGDDTYAQRKSPYSKLLQGQFLHAWKLQFKTQSTGSTEQIIAPLPAVFQEILQDLGFEKALVINS